MAVLLPFSLSVLGLLPELSSLSWSTNAGGMIQRLLDLCLISFLVYTYSEDISVRPFMRKPSLLVVHLTP